MRRASGTGVASVVVALLLSPLVAVYVTAPVEKLRAGVAYWPNGPAEERVAGLGEAENLRLADIPEALLVGLVFSEDRKFFAHHGFDFEEIRNSIRDYLLRGKRLRGASTISQQLVRTVFLTPERSLRRKLIEAVYTLKLERHFSKEEILVLYVNGIEWGPGIYGLRQAVEYYLRKPVSDLSIAESAFLVSLVANPAERSRGWFEGALRWQTVWRMRRLGALLSNLDGSGAGASVNNAEAAAHAQATQVLESVRKVSGGSGARRLGF